MDSYPLQRFLYELGMGRITVAPGEPITQELAERYQLSLDMVEALNTHDLNRLWAWKIHPLLLMQWSIAEHLDMEAWVHSAAQMPVPGIEKGGEG